MKEIHTEIQIDATADQVWRVLTDFASYPEWSSRIRPDGGNPQAGARIRVQVRVAGNLGFGFRPTVLTVEPGREFCWVGRLPARLLEGRHSFSIVPLQRNRVHFIHREVYGGILVPVYMWIMKGWLRRTYERMNQELKLRVERAVAA